MDSTISSLGNGSSWEIVPTNTIAGITLAGLFFYLLFRHFMFSLMFMDVILGWLRKFDWFPKKGKRRKTIIHWFIALGLVLGFLAAAGSVGWLKFIPK